MTGQKVSGDFAHTPWDGSHPAFRIGLAPLGEGSWIEVDDRFGSQMREKRRLLAARHRDVFRAEPASAMAQDEALELVLAELARAHQATHRRSAVAVETPDGHVVDLAGDAVPPLEKAARLIQEDLVIMVRGDDGWRLAAGCVCFPSSWVLAEKFGKPLQHIHAPVPQFGPGTKNATIINRIFDNLRPDMPVVRFNWSIHGDDELFHGDRRDDGEQGRPVPDYLRVEVQTLHKMARTGAVLFTIRIHVDALKMLETHPDRRQLALGLADSLAALDADQCRYKGLGQTRGKLLSRLHALAGSAE